MFIDSAEFPLVWIKNDGSDVDGAAGFVAFELLLMRKEPFVMIGDGSGYEMDSHKHSQEELKQMSLWMKQHKADIRAFVQGMIVIEPNVAKRIAAKAFSVIFGKFWGYPMFTTASKEEALQMAGDLLHKAII